jgi:Raf kinase inhibitor-like YbhB/YbcL family protein
MPFSENHVSGDHRPRIRPAAALIIALIAVIAACNDDGRTMRPASPDQSASVSTTAPVTDPPAPGAADGELGVPPVTVVPPTVTTSPQAVPPLLVVSAPWPDGGVIDPHYTCDGENVSPFLAWTDPPEGTVEIAIVATDDDAPGFVHWALAALDPLSTSLGEARVPEFAIQGVNSAGTPGYTGPCPPRGETHTYHFTVYFLGRQTVLPDGAPGEDLLDAIRANAFDSASASGTYSRP